MLDDGGSPAAASVLPKAEVVFDKFHVLQHASAALDDVRRQEFFRAGAVMRAYGCGKRWLLLRRWKTVRGSKRGELQQLFAAHASPDSIGDADAEFEWSVRQVWEGGRARF